MGIDPADPNYNCHHILYRSDFKHDYYIKDAYDKNYLDSKANLFPLPLEDHRRLHQLQEEERVLYKASKRRQK
jgi:hypothetical protein